MPIVNHAFAQSTVSRPQNRYGPDDCGRHPVDHPLINPAQGSAGSWPMLITVAGISRWNPGDFWRRKCCGCLVVEQVIAGEIDLEQDGRRHVVQPGQVFLLHPGSGHEIRTHGKGIVQKRHFLFSGYMVEPFLRLSGLVAVDVVTPADPARFVTLCKRAYRLLAAQAPGFCFELSGVANLMLLALAQSTGPTYPPLVRTTIEFIQRNLDKAVTDEAMAEHAGVSINSLWGVFKKARGVTPLQFHMRERMVWAEALLKQTAMSAKEIAYRIGFDDPLYFSKVFKKYQGRTPSAIRGRTP